MIKVRTNPLPRPYRLVWTLVRILLGIAGLTIVIIWLVNAFTFSWATAAVQREPAIPSAQFQLINTLADVYTDLPFALTDNKVVIVGSRAPDEEPLLMSLDLATGQQAWQMEDGQWGQLAAAAGYVYAEDQAGWGSRVIAYDAVTGEEVWQKHFLTRIENLAIVEERLAVSAYMPMRSAFRRFFSHFYLLNPATGEVEGQKRSNAEGMFMIENLERFYEATPGSVRVTGPNPWETKLDLDAFYVEDEPFRYKPLLYDNLILAKTGADQVGHVYALDRENGSFRWHKDEVVVGNIAVAYSMAYILTESGQLMAVDINTGEPTGILYFAPGLQALDQFDFYMAAHHDIVAVYLGDSRQLFVFRFAPPA